MEDLDTFLVDEVELPVKKVIADMATTGYLMDASYLQKVIKRVEPKTAKVLARIHDLVGFDLDPNSSIQVEELLYDKLKLKVYKYMPDGGRATDDDTISRQRKRVIHPLLRYRQLTRVVSNCRTLAEQLGDDGRLRVEYDLTSEATGRIMAKSPVQSLPPYDEFGIRKAFRAARGHKIVTADYRQLELRVLAHESGDDDLLAGIADDVDLHGLAAVKVFRLACGPNEVAELHPDERYWIKLVQFFIVKGQTNFDLTVLLRTTDRQAVYLLREYHLQFHPIGSFIRDVHESAQRDGYVEDFFGNGCEVPDAVPDWALRCRPQPPDVLRQAASNVRVGCLKAQNFIIQAPVATIVKLGMVRCHELIKSSFPDVRMVLALHNELHFEVPDAQVDRFAAALPAAMCDLGLDRFDFDLPLAVDLKVGPSWGKAAAWPCVTSVST